MQDTSRKTAGKKPPPAHEDDYRNDPPVEDLPKTGDKRGESPSSRDPSAGHVDEHRHRPGKDSKDES